MGGKSVYVICFVIPYGEEKHKTKGPEDTGTILPIFSSCVFLHVFSLPKTIKTLKHVLHGTFGGSDFKNYNNANNNADLFFKGPLNRIASDGWNKLRRFSG